MYSSKNASPIFFQRSEIMNSIILFLTDAGREPGKYSQRGLWVLGMDGISTFDSLAFKLLGF